MAGLVAAGSVAMLVALVTVPSMMLSTSEQAPMSVERIPSPVAAGGPQAEPKPDQVRLDESAATTVAPAEVPPPTEPAKPKRATAARHRAARALRREPSGRVSTPPADEKAQLAEDKSKARSNKVAKSEAPAERAETRGFTGDARKPSSKPRDTIEDEDGVARTTRLRTPAKDAPTLGGEAADDVVAAGPRRSGSSVAGADAPPAPPPAPRPTVQPVAPATRIDSTEEVLAQKEAKKSESVEGQARETEAMQEERGRAMLSAASAEFKRGNPEGGRQILIRALSLTGRAPVHAEIAFRLAQDAFDQKSYDQALQYARIAASAPKFNKRKAALDLMIEAEKRLAEASDRSKSDLDLAPAAQPESR